MYKIDRRGGGGGPKNRILGIYLTLPCGHVISHKNLGLIGSVVLTFIGYKKTDKPNLYIDYAYIILSKDESIYNSEN